MQDLQRFTSILRKISRSRVIPKSNMKGTHLHVTIANSTSYSQNRFKNLGNTCYINAVLQSLTSLKPFTYDMLQYTPPDPKDSTTVPQNPPPKLDLHEALLGIILEVSCGNHGVVNPKRLKDSLSHYCSTFAGYAQQVMPRAKP